MANLAVFGMGYVGSITAACFASKGHHVIGVDVNPDKIELLRRGEPTVAEPGLRDLVSAAFEKGNSASPTWWTMRLAAPIFPS
jgi:GDP-mannose 6-dehydrogenase